MIKQSRETLPRTTEGQPPDPEPRFIPALLNAWYEQYLADGNDERATANGSLLRGSDAGTCSRQLSYELRRRRGDAGMERTNPLTVADAYRFNIGSLVHEVFQSALVKAYPGAEVEVVGVFEDPDLSLHADAKVTHPDGKVTAIELKSVGGFAFKQQTTGGKTPAEGPRLSALLQGAMAALAFDADELVIAVLSLELLSPREAARQGRDEYGRCGAEWTYPRDLYEPMARAELARLGNVLELVTEGSPVPRVIPGLMPLGAEVVDPSTGRWELRNPEGTHILDSGTAWMCNGYCGHATRCAEDKAAGQ